MTAPPRPRPVPPTETVPGAAPAPVTFIGVRHHSPACARLVTATIEDLEPAHVLIEGPADMNDRLDELLLGHELPVAIYTSYRDEGHAHSSWSPLCEYSPEWAALSTGRRTGAEVRFIDLPAWHPAFADRENRYADAEARYTEVLDQLCRAFAMDNVDTLWDHLVEVDPGDGLAERLATYFDLIRGDTAASAADTAREAYMATWVRAAMVDAGGRPVVVVTGGFHRPALIRLVAGAGAAAWPPVPRFPAGAIGGSFLVPFSFKRLDAFHGYQSGMPSPGFYQQVWDGGPESATAFLLQAVVERLRRRGQPVSTADLIAGRAMADGLARLRGHPWPARTDVLDGLVSALVTDALDIPLPWTGRGGLRAGTDPVVVEMVAALSGDRVGRLHPDTPMPPLVHTALADLERCGRGEVRLVLTEAADLERSRILHRLRVLNIPEVRRLVGPTTGAEPVLHEEWEVVSTDHTLPALIEAGAYGVTLAAAAGAALTERAAGDPSVDSLTTVVVDAACCGLGELAASALGRTAAAIGQVNDLGPLGRALATALGLWRYDGVYGIDGDVSLGSVISAAAVRVLWLVEGVHGGPSPADLDRIGALVATRDAIRYAAPALADEPEGKGSRLDPAAALAVMHRIAIDGTVPPDLRGAALGFAWSLGDSGGGPAVRAARGASAPDSLGDWLAGLFALAREEVLATEGDDSVLGVLDEVLSNLPEHDFLVALPALRQAFVFFPPSEREVIAAGLLARRGLGGSGRSLLRLAVAPEVIAEGREIEARVEEVLSQAGLGQDRGGPPADEQSGPPRPGTAGG